MMLIVTSKINTKKNSKRYSKIDDKEINWYIKKCLFTEWREKGKDTKHPEKKLSGRFKWYF